MDIKGKIVASIVVASVVTIALAACTSTPPNKAEKARADKEASVIMCGQKGESLECVNLREKLKRDSDPNRVTYLYEMSWTGEFIGYYVVKGKVSSTQSQMAPMDEGVRICPSNWTGVSAACYALGEAPGDDGSFGPNEDGIFFFATDGNKITWNGMYQQSDKPLDIKVPLLYSAK